MMSCQFLNQLFIRLPSCTGEFVNFMSARHSSMLAAPLVFYPCSFLNATHRLHKLLEWTLRQAPFLSYLPLPKSNICKTSIFIRPTSQSTKRIRKDVGLIKID